MIERELRILLIVLMFSILSVINSIGRSSSYTSDYDLGAIRGKQISVHYLPQGTQIQA
jgi:hypothetical protein